MRKQSLVNQSNDDFKCCFAIETLKCVVPIFPCGWDVIFRESVMNAEVHYCTIRYDKFSSSAKHIHAQKKKNNSSIASQKM